jgi:1,4-dihydroxy-6-naphthoate synthase
MDERVMRQHIDLYVNDYSLSLGEDGAKAIETLLQTYARVHA